MPCLVLAIAALFLASPVDAQSRNQVSLSAGAMVVGDDGRKPAISATAETIGARGLSAGADVVVLFGRTGFRPRFPNGQPYRQYLFTGLVGAHGVAARGYAPFVNGGVSVITDPDCCGPGALLNIGGGTNYWFSDRVGLRGDVRVGLSFGGYPVLALGRMGLVFR